LFSSADEFSEAIKVTPLRIANVPPPMSLHEIQLEQPAIDVGVSDSGDEIYVLTERTLNVYKYDISVKPLSSPSLLTTYSVIDESAFPRRIWTKSAQPMVVCDSFDCEPFLLDVIAQEASAIKHYPEEFLEAEMEATTHPWTRTSVVDGIVSSVRAAAL